MLYRKFYDYMMKWKEEPKKKALFISGARQIGNNVKLEIM